MRGIINCGSTCYLSAALQCVLHSPQLVNYLLTDLCLGDDLQVRKRNAVAFTKALVALARETWLEPRSSSLNPAPLLESLAKVKKPFAKMGQQHDAHECILAILDTLHQGLSKMPAITQSVARETLREDAGNCAAWDAHCARDYSFLAELFQGQSKRQGTAYEHFWSVSLNIGGDDTALHTMLLKHFEGEGATVTYAPLLLVIHFNRFDAKGQKFAKFISYGLELQFAGNEYALYAVCMHRGTADDGHYTAICENHSQWMHFDDETSNPVTNPDTIIQKDAYVLFYKKVLL